MTKGKKRSFESESNETSKLINSEVQRISFSLSKESEDSKR